MKFLFLTQAGPRPVSVGYTYKRVPLTHISCKDGRKLYRQKGGPSNDFFFLVNNKIRRKVSFPEAAQRQTHHKMQMLNVMLHPEKGTPPKKLKKNRKAMIRILITIRLLGFPSENMQVNFNVYRKTMGKNIERYTKTILVYAVSNAFLLWRSQCSPLNTSLFLSLPTHISKCILDK